LLPPIVLKQPVIIDIFINIRQKGVRSHARTQSAIYPSM